MDPISMAVSAMASKQASTQQAIATSMLKVAADSSQKMADLLAQSVESVSVSASRGGNVNLSV